MKKSTQKNHPFEYHNEINEKDIILKKGYGEKLSKNVVLKKNKIRRFMEVKKKEMINQ